MRMTHAGACQTSAPARGAQQPEDDGLPQRRRPAPRPHPGALPLLHVDRAPVGDRNGFFSLVIKCRGFNALSDAREDNWDRILFYNLCLKA